MRAWEIGSRADGARGIEGMRLVERPEPVPGPGEVLLKVTAAGLNYRDLMVLRGEYGSDLPENRIPLTDGVGVVEALGEGVEGFAVGDRVVAQNFLTWIEQDGYGFHVFADDLGVTRDGWLTEKLVLPASAAIKLPDAVSDETAATLAVVACTVWHAMVAFGNGGDSELAGKLVLAQGTGGVSIFALQLAKVLGAEFAITSSSDEKLSRAREMGADYTINYRERPDWGAAVIEATGGRGADIVVDTIGFGDFANTLTATGVNGRIATLGALSGSPQDSPDFGQGDLIGKNMTIKGIASGSRDMFEAALDVIAAHGLAMVVDRSFAFEDAQDAYRHIQSAAHMGKVMIRVG